MQTVCNTYWDAGKGNLTAQNTRKHFGGPGSTPDPIEGAYSAAANPLVGGDGLAVASPRTPIPALDPSDLSSPTHTPKLVPMPLISSFSYYAPPLIVGGH